MVPSPPFDWECYFIWFEYLLGFAGGVSDEKCNTTHHCVVRALKKDRVKRESEAENGPAPTSFCSFPGIVIAWPVQLRTGLKAAALHPLQEAFPQGNKWLKTYSLLLRKAEPKRSVYMKNT